MWFPQYPVVAFNYSIRFPFSHLPSVSDWHCWSSFNDLIQFGLSTLAQESRRVFTDNMRMAWSRYYPFLGQTWALKLKPFGNSIVAIASLQSSLFGCTGFSIFSHGLSCFGQDQVSCFFVFLLLPSQLPSDSSYKLRCAAMAAKANWVWRGVRVTGTLVFLLDQNHCSVIAIRKCSVSLLT